MYNNNNNNNNNSNTLIIQKTEVKETMIKSCMHTRYFTFD